MARHGRGFPLGTQYQAAWRLVPTNALSGTGTMTLSGTGALSVITSTVQVSVDDSPHRFRSVQVPSLEDFGAVQRQMQRSLDEVSRAVNPVRTVLDGGTGLTEVSAGALVTGTDSSNMETVPIGSVGQVLTVVAGMPAWAAAGGPSAGEANTATNVGVGGVGVVSGKVGVDLQFRSINAASSKVSVALDAGNKEVDLDVVEANLVLSSIGGSLIIGQVPANLVTFAKLQDITTDRLIGRDTALTGDPEEIALAGSLVFTGALSIQLSGDSAAPGNTKLYGTDGAGVKGWYAQPAGGPGGTGAIDRTPGSNIALATDESMVVVGEYNMAGNELFIPSTAELWIR